MHSRETSNQACRCTNTHTVDCDRRSDLSDLPGQATQSTFQIGKPILGSTCCCADVSFDC